MAETQIKTQISVLCDKNRPLKERFRALFTLKNLGGEAAISAISGCFQDDSVLLKHELAYCLGQMQDARAVETLSNVLRDVTQEPMVRHEAAEALGAIAIPDVIPILEEYRNDPVIEVAETCAIALDRIKWIQNGNKVKDTNPYRSVDPSPPADIQSIDQLKEIYMNTENSLFDRYRAMFSLRNLMTKESVLAIAEGLKDKSALFRHEVAFVLGQIQDPCSIPYLEQNLIDQNENEMVRHECAEALGAIATPECMKILEYFSKDEKRVVKESCEIALDICDYENNSEFQFAIN